MRGNCQKHTFLDPSVGGNNCQKGKIQAARIMGLSRKFKTGDSQECQEYAQIKTGNPYKPVGNRE